jgi:hypothetical protein
VSSDGFMTIVYSPAAKYVGESSLRLISEGNKAVAITVKNSRIGFDVEGMLGTQIISCLPCVGAA